MLEIGKYNSLVVNRLSDFGAFLGYDDGEVLLPNRYAENLQAGDKVRVFIYHDSEDRLVATTETPLVQRNEFAPLYVKEVNRVGAFMDWGLYKDLLVPFAEQHREFHKGETYVVRVLLDPRTERLIGTSKIDVFLEKDQIRLQEGQAVKIMVYDFTDLGAKCLINQKYSGLLFYNEIFKPLHIGDQCEAFVKTIRADNKIDICLRQGGYQEIVSEADIILEKLKENNGKLAFSDSSSPEEIKQFFGMSKKTFKKLIGLLYKEQKIVITENEIRLK